MRLVVVLAAGLFSLLLPALPASAQQLVVCGWDEVFVLDVAGTPRRIWSWKAADRPELPAGYAAKFRTTDDCKPVAGDRILVTSSTDGAALVDRATGVARWWGECGNTHSADLLPGDRVVLACSVRAGTGNRLALFDARVPEREIFSTELPSGHGAVWDAGRQRLWALGDRELRAYTLQDWASDAPRLALQASYALPDEGGHELATVAGSPELIVSTTHGVWRFDRDATTFVPDPDLRDLNDVKSVTIDPVTGRLAYTRADLPEWWTSRIRFLHPAGEVHLDGERLYKVRWMR